MKIIILLYFFVASLLSSWNSTTHHIEVHFSELRLPPPKPYEHLAILLSNGPNHRLYGRHEHDGLQQYLRFGDSHSVRDLAVPVCGCGTSVLHTVWVVTL